MGLSTAFLPLSMALIPAASLAAPAAADSVHRRIALVMFDNMGNDQASLREGFRASLVKRGVDVVPPAQVAEKAFGLAGFQCGPTDEDAEKTLKQVDALTADGKPLEAATVARGLIESLEKSWEPTDAQLASLRRTRLKAAYAVLTATGQQVEVARSDSEQAKAARSYLKAILRTSPMFALDARETAPAMRLALDYARLEVQKEPTHILSVQSDIPGLDVFVDGQKLGVTPIQHALPEGKYRVWTQKGARRSVMRFVSLARNTEVDVKFTEEPAMRMCTLQYLGWGPDLTDQRLGAIAGAVNADLLLVQTGKVIYIRGSDSPDYDIYKDPSHHTSMSAMVRVELYEASKGVVTRRAEMIQRRDADLPEELVSFAMGERVPLLAYSPTGLPPPLCPLQAYCDGCEIEGGTPWGTVDVLAGAPLPSGKGQAILAKVADGLRWFEVRVTLKEGASVDGPPGQWLAQVYAGSNNQAVVMLTQRDAEHANLRPLFLKAPTDGLQEGYAAAQEWAVPSTDRLLGGLLVSSSVKGAELKVDGLPLTNPRNITWDRHRVGLMSPGVHVLEVRFPGLTWVTINVPVAGEETSVVVLRSKDGHVSHEVKAISNRAPIPESWFQ